MDTEFIRLPEEIERYRNRMSKFYWNKTMPQKIKFKWSSEIEAANLYSMGEEGAYIYIKGRNLNEKSLIQFAIQAETFGHLNMANGFWKRAYLKSMSINQSLSANMNRKKPIEHESPKLKVFLCHSSNDKLIVEKYYNALKIDGVEPWLDKVNLIPGQEWKVEIPKAVENSHVVIVFLSSGSVNKEGYVQKEIRIALDVAEQKPFGTIFIIPARLEICDVPERLKEIHWVNLFEQDGYERLLEALQIRANSLGILINNKTHRNSEFTSEAAPVYTEFRKLVRVSPNGKVFAVTSSDGSIGFFDNKTKDILIRLKHHSEYVHDIAFSPDGKSFFSTDSQGTIEWDLRNGILNAKIIS